MIALVTQFDHPSRRPSLAAPSGASSSSCCCCCIATAIGVSIFSAIHVGSIRRRALEAPSEAGRPVAPKPWPGVLGLFALTLAIAAGVLAAFVEEAALLFVTPLAWVVLLYLAYRGAGDRARGLHAVLTVVCAVVIGGVEFMVWLAAFS